MYILGIDIGGTKCAVITALYDNGNLTLLKKEQCATDLGITPEKMICRLIALAEKSLSEKPDAIGISCGGPLDSENGVILNPPNLPGWNRVEIVKQIEEHFGVKPILQNDANASAVAEWKFGAGKGCRNMVFLTFGTGLGAGLILDGKLYNGTNGNAGEVGHIRLESDGPVGHGKKGSFEGFCSGGGIAQLGYTMALKNVEKKEYPLYFREGMEPKDVTARTIAEAADKGDKTALEVYRISGEHLGKGLSILIDILNPEVIVIGSIFFRSHHLLWERAKEIIDSESLTVSAECCKVLPALLGENTGDYAAIAVALEGNIC